MRDDMDQRVTPPKRVASSMCPPPLPGNRPLDSSLVRLTRHLNPRIFACRMWNPFCHLFPFISSTLIVLFDCNSNKQRTMFLFFFFLCFFLFVCLFLFRRGQPETFSKLLLTCVTRLSRDFFVLFLSSRAFLAPSALSRGRLMTSLKYTQPFNLYNTQ